MAGYIEAKFNPLPDITAYELAIIVSKRTGYQTGTVRFDPDKWENLDHSIKRHFELAAIVD
jgi:hypothetical protein